MKDFKSQKIKAVIKELLKKKKITYEELGEVLECSIPTIKRILGPEELTLNRLLQLCEVVGIDLAELEALTQDSQEKEEKFTSEQESFLAKNKSYFAYLLKLLAGETPKQIAETYGITPRSTDKYLIGLEKHDLIRVTGKQKVKPNFKNSPSLGKGPLARAYFEAIINNAASFFIKLIQERLKSDNKNNLKKGDARFTMRVVKVSEPTYRAFAEEQEKAFRNFEKMASFEEKTKAPSELMVAVTVEANAIVEANYPDLKVFDSTLGEITNL